MLDHAVSIALLPARTLALVAGLVLSLALAAVAETRMIRPAHARPEDIETVVNRLVPKAGVAAVPRQGSVLLNAEGDDLQQALRVIREIDAPNQVLEFEIGMTGSTRSLEQTRGTGGTVQRGRRGGSAPPPVPTELSRNEGGGRSDSRQSVVAMQGSPVELFIGETQLRDGGPLSPPLEVQAGRKIRIEGLRVIEDGKGAEMEVSIENTVPGAGPVVSSGTRVKTQVRLMVGQSQNIATQDESTDAGTSSRESSGDDSGGRARIRRSRHSGSTAGMVTITLKRIH